MSFTAMAWASKQKVKSASQKLVLLMLANYADDEDKCWPSKQTLANVCCLSKSTVCALILTLGDLGLLEVETREGTSSIIRLKTGCPDTGQGVSDNRTGGVRPQDTNLSSNLSSNQSTEPINKEKENTKEKESRQFDEFWAVYPKRPGDSKKKAEEKYRTAIKGGATHEQIMAGVVAYARTRHGHNPVYTAMAKTWLHQECWKADYGPEPIPMHIDEFCRLYPSQNIGSRALVENYYQAAIQSTPHEKIMEGLEKYCIFVKQKKGEGYPLQLPAAAVWLQYQKWQEMDNYDIAFRGMGEKYLRAKRGEPNV